MYKEHNPRKWEIDFCSYQADLARLEGRSDDAINYARQRLLLANQSDSKISVGTAARQLACCFLRIGDTQRAKDILCSRLQIRHSESGFLRYYTHQLLGDYHLACAREAAGLMPADDEFGFEFPPPANIVNPKLTYQKLMHARHRYNTALKIGQWIDEQLQCSVMQEEMAIRYLRVENIERALS